LDLQGRRKCAHLHALQRLKPGRGLLGEHHGRAVVDGADDAKAAIEKHRLHVIAIGGLMDDRVNVLRRGEQAGHVENLEARIGRRHEGRRGDEGLDRAESTMRGIAPSWLAGYISVLTLSPTRFCRSAANSFCHSCCTSLMVALASFMTVWAATGCADARTVTARAANVACSNRLMGMGVS